MRVLLVGGVDLSLPGGLETHVLELARCLTASGHEVTIEGRASSTAPLPVVPSADPAAYDVVHHHGGPWPGRRSIPDRYVRTFHFSVAAKMEVYLRMGRLKTLVNPGNYRALAEERAAMRRPGARIAVSESLRRDLARHHGVDPESIQVIPNGARFDPPRAGRETWRARHGIDPNAPLLLTIGRSDYVKGFDRIDRLWEDRGAIPSRALWVRIGGERPLRTTTRIVTGPIPPDEVTEWIHAADVGAVPSYYEGGGIALLDMLAGGLYVLAHDVGVAPDVIRPGRNGEILPRSPRAWREALGRILHDPPGRLADALPPEYRWESITARVEHVYRDIVRPCVSSS